MNENSPTRFMQHEDAGQGMHSLVRMLRVLFFFLRLLIVLVFALGLTLGGLFFVEEHERGMLFRFGELQRKGDSDILRSGKWYWKWPYPIDEVRMIPAQRSVTLLSTQFWPKQQDTGLSGSEPQPEAPEKLRPGEDGYLLTADANIVHTVWSVTYTVSDAKRYYLGLYDAADAGDAVNGSSSSAEAIIRDVLNGAVLRAAATWKIEDILVLQQRGESGAVRVLSETVREEFEMLVEQLDLGINVQQVSLREIQPPGATVQAFREVLDAAQEHREKIDNAKALERRVIAGAEGEAARILGQARAYKTRVTSSVAAAEAYFREILNEYKKYEDKPEAMLVSLYMDAVREVLANAETTYVIRAKEDGNQEIRLMLGPEPSKPGQPQDEIKTR